MTSTGKAICCAIAGSAQATDKHSAKHTNAGFNDHRRQNSLRLAKPFIARKTTVKEYPNTTPSKQKYGMTVLKTVLETRLSICHETLDFCQRHNTKIRDEAQTVQQLNRID
jgi:hypothetical protein